MKTNTKMSLAMGLFLGFTSTTFAEGTDVKVSGQIRERSSYTNKSADYKNTFSNGNDKHELRSRIAVEAKTSDASLVHVEIQDSRDFGTEPNGVEGVPHTSTIGNAQGVDLHQAYFVLGLGEWDAKVGRQKIALGSQRMVSSLEWHPNARVFDAFRFDGKVGPGALTAMASLTNDSGKKAYTSLSGLYYGIKFDGTEVDVYSFYDKNTQAAAGLKNWDLVYLGERAKLGFGDFFLEEEFIYQMGEVRTIDTPVKKAKSMKSSAFYLATRLGMKLDKHVFSLGYDVMSGDDGTDDKFNVYMNNYTFAHAYFGWMDYFVVNKKDTGGKGVSDVRVDASLALAETSTLKLAYHYFAPAAGTGKSYGQEVDAELHGKWFAKANIVFGAAMFIPGEGLTIDTDGNTYDGKPQYSFYFMPIVNF